MLGRLQLGESSRFAIYSPNLASKEKCLDRGTRLRPVRCCQSLMMPNQLGAVHLFEFDLAQPLFVKCPQFKRTMESLFQIRRRAVLPLETRYFYRSLSRRPRRVQSSSNTAKKGSFTTCFACRNPRSLRWNVSSAVRMTVQVIRN